MKTYFLFHDRWCQYIKADWAASRFPFDGFIVIRKTRPWFGEYLWKRARRIGFGKVADELALRCYWLLRHGARDNRMLKELMARVQKDIPPTYKRPPVYHVDDINSDEAARLLRELAPDACVLMVHPIIKEKIFSIPRLGMLVFHPGVTPEYRGPHSAFWATLNQELWGIGWSLLRINKGIDTGQVLAQATTKDVDPLTESHVFMQHKAHVDGMPAVVEVLRKLEVGEQPVVPMVNRKSTNYTHPGLSDYFKLRKVLKAMRKAASPG
jgi:hypothetical protein